MKLLTKENIDKNQVDTIPQYEILQYLKQMPLAYSSQVFLLDRYTIKIIDKNNETGYFQYNSETKKIDFSQELSNPHLESQEQEISL